MQRAVVGVGSKGHRLTPLAAGLRLDAITATLGITRYEVAEHRPAAMAALGATNLIHALILGLRAGLVEPPA